MILASASEVSPGQHFQRKSVFEGRLGQLLLRLFDVVRIGFYVRISADASLQTQ